MNSTSKKVFSDKKFFQHVLKANAVQIEKSAEFIKLFGGQIEQFLDNEVNYVLTDIPRSEWPPQGRDSILQNASRLGVKLMSLDDLRRWCSKYVSSQSSSDEDDEATDITRLKTPFIKIEDSNCRYRPIYREFNQWPRLTFNENQQAAKSPINNNNNNRRRRSFFCELCNINVSERIEDHIENEQHKLKIEEEKWSPVYKVMDSIPSISTLNMRRLTNLTPPDGQEHQEFICLHKVDSVDQLFR